MISLELKGRLGNQLFQYAFCRTLAEKNGYDFCIPDNWAGKGLFTCSTGKNFKKQKKVVNGPEIINNNFDISDGIHLNGYWDSEKYFEGYENKIREWFYLKPSDSEYAKDNFCVIHFRGKDYINTKQELPKSFFEDAKKKIKCINDNIEFVVITDDIEQAKKKFDKKDIIISDSRNSDFKLLMSSKHKIISNSTFSWWAAWLGLPFSKMVIAPNRWMNYNFNISNKDVFIPQNKKKTDGFIYI